MKIRYRSAALVAAALVGGCQSGGGGAATSQPASGSDGGAAADGAPASAGDLARITPVFTTDRDELANVDSPAVWHGPDGQHWLLATAKEGDVIRVSDAATGEAIQSVGGEGQGAGELDRPNGIAVVDDVMFVVERDNARVQVFSLPAFDPLGSFGEGILERPYGIAIADASPGSRGTTHAAPELASSADHYTVFITDAYELPGEQIPPDSLLDERVHRFSVRVDGNALTAHHVEAFGETEGPGVLHVVESLQVDPVQGILLIAEERETNSHIVVYTMDGEFTGRTIEHRYFPHQAEGIMLYACDDGGGYWIATDQGEDVNTFHVFARRGLEHLASFSGEGVLNTDGIALTQRAFADFPAGAFYAVHDDGNVAAFSMAEIAGALGIRSDCTRPA